MSRGGTEAGGPVGRDGEGVVGVSGVYRPVEGVSNGHDGSTQVRRGRLLGHPDESCSRLDIISPSQLTLTYLPQGPGRISPR